MKYSLGDKHVQCPDNTYVAPNATLIGSIVLGEEASVWFNAVIRGDTDVITIGARTNIQDGSVLHTDTGLPMTIGRDVTVGHMVMLHGCTIADECLIGIGSVILNRVKVGRHCIIGANSLIPEGKEIPERSLVMGSPGKVVRQVTDDEVAFIKWHAEHYAAKIPVYREQLVAKD